jgi:ElaB/YqjD/DUF883 family membrane-anchored ribosome-binding protein
MTDQKNQPGGTPSSQKSPGAESGGGAKVSAGTSVGSIGQTPMPHAQTSAGDKPAQSATLASHTSAPLGGGDRTSTQNRSSQDSSMTDNTKDTARQAAGDMRERAGQTADQVRRKAGDAYETASDWAQDAYERTSRWASDRTSSSRDRLGDMRDRSTRGFGQARNSVQSYVAENPMVVGIVGLAAGLLLGALLPRTRSEDEMFGEWADEVRSQGLRYARDATQRGREYVEDAFSGDEDRFSRHESEFRHDRPDATSH